MKFQIIQKIDKGGNYKVKTFYNGENVDLIMNGEYLRKERFDFEEEVAKQLLDKKGEPVPEKQVFADGAEVIESDIDENLPEDEVETVLDKLDIEAQENRERWKEQVWSKEGLQEQQDYVNRLIRKHEFKKGDP